ncbi:MAG: anthranilate synthase component I [Micrococcaceae bacterium]
MKLLIEPDLEGFKKQAQSRKVISVYAKLHAEHETPLSIYAKLAYNKAGCFLMESAESEGTWSRYSFIGVNSVASLQVNDGQAHWKGRVPEGIPTEGPVLEVLKETLVHLHTEFDPNLPPFTSGLVGYFGWDTVKLWENLNGNSHDDLNIPTIYLNMVSDMIVFDNKDNTIMVIANAFNMDNTDDNVEMAYQDAHARVQILVRELQKQSELSYMQWEDISAEAEESWEEEQYLKAIAVCQEAIKEGETFQIVLSRRFELKNKANPVDIYRVLRANNPSPYMYIYHCEDANEEQFSIIGSSPETLVKVRDSKVITHPIAGSRPRGENTFEDYSNEKSLIKDQKEISEHLMLVDLSRNDLSKVCKAGTVTVNDFMHVEKYSHIMHLVTEVTGELAANHDAVDVLQATFPAGTLSGAPKPRALKIIEELEPQSRGVYGGVVGYMDYAGNMDVAIAIRTALLRGNKAYVQAGAGIVADSKPENESLESKNKAAAPLNAVATAQNIRPVY